MEPMFFATPADWRNWLEKNHSRKQELLVGLYKKNSGKPSITWPESVDAALCFGWIDGIRRRIDDESYTIRFTPRQPRSAWSAINIKRVAELAAKQLMHPAGMKAFEARREERSGAYSFEQQSIKFERVHEQVFRANKSAWKYFRSQAPWYQRTVTWWVVSAKRPETREKRLAALIGCSEQEQPIPQLARTPKSE
jgi:uncharacterized protein YdeI (YjbR/CyaY-like superfamily)